MLKLQDHLGMVLVMFNKLAKIYNRALTAQEIQQNFNATKSRYGL